MGAMEGGSSEPPETPLDLPLESYGEIGDPSSNLPIEV